MNHMKNEKPDVIETNLMDILPVLSKGEVLATINQKLGDVVGAAKATQKKGSVTVTITVDPSGGQATVGAEVKSKVPEHTIPSSIFFTTDNGGLLRRNPNQPELFGEDAE